MNVAKNGRLKSFKIVSSQFFVMEFDVEIDGKQVLVEKLLPLQGSGQFYTRKFLNENFGASDGSINQLVFDRDFTELAQVVLEENAAYQRKKAEAKNEQH